MQDKAAAPAKDTATTAPAAPATAPAAGGAATPGGLAGQLARSIPPAPVIDTRTPAVVIRGGQPFEIPAGLEPAEEEKKVTVRARFSDMAAGELRLQRKKSGLETEGSGFQGLSLNHPLLNPLRAVGIEPVIAVKVRNGAVLARASGMKGGRVWADAEEVLKNVQRNAEALGWHGLDALRLTGLSNTVAGDTLTLGASDLHFGISKFLNASGSLAATNRIVTFTATATGKVPGLGTVTVPIELAPDGTLIGSAKIDVAELKGFSGSLDARYARGLIDIQGTIHYANDKFDGSVTLAVTDAASAKALTQAHMPQEVASAAPAGGAATAAPSVAEATAPASENAAPKPGPRVVCGWGTVNIQLAEWLSGEAMVVVDHLGDVTIVGKITPKMTKPLFEQRDYLKQLPKLEVRAAYGLPVVGNIFLFANVGLELVAKLGPATLDRMEMTGTYSTKPEVLQSFGLTGTLNISAFAGVRLSAEGGAGLEILDHDIKAGAKISALAGIRGYVDATPRIGYRELADPKAGKRGEFFIGGHLDIAAQPFLLLSGELFVSLDSPWWSPAPSKRWPWPLGQLEYPLPGEFGIGADVEHVLGSGKTPEIAFSDVAFDSSRFMTDLMDDHVPAKKSGGEVEKKGEWKEAAEPGAAAAPAAAPPGPGAPASKAPAPTPSARPTATPAEKQAPSSKQGSSDKDAAAPPNGEDVAGLDEPFDVAGVHHHIYVAPSGVIMIASEPHPAAQEKSLAKLISQFYAKPTPSKAQRRRLLVSMSTILKKQGLQTPRASAPGIGEPAPYRHQTPRLRNEKLYPKVWQMTAEHVIPGDLASSLFKALGLPELENFEYRGLQTILIYRGAADEKTQGRGDTRLLSIFRSLVETREAADVAGGHEPASYTTSSGKTYRHLVRNRENLERGFNMLANGAVRRTIDAVATEKGKTIEPDGETNAQRRGPENSPEPSTPTESAVRAIANEELEQIRGMVEQRRNEQSD